MVRRSVHVRDGRSVYVRAGRKLRQSKEGMDWTGWSFRSDLIAVGCAPVLCTTHAGYSSSNYLCSMSVVSFCLSVKLIIFFPSPDGGGKVLESVLCEPNNSIGLLILAQESGLNFKSKWTCKFNIGKNPIYQPVLSNY
jgi:hypothetical protein